MIIGVVAAILAALAYGTASVLQARGARDAEQSVQLEPLQSEPLQSEPLQREALQPGHAEAGTGTRISAPSLRSTITAMLTVSFLAGMALDALGFVGSLVSARLAPLFLSQTIISANLIVTAVLAVFVLDTRPSRRDWIAIGVVVVSLVVLGISAAGEGHRHDGVGLHWAVLGVGLGLLVIGVVAIRSMSGPVIALTAGILGGVLFGVMAVAVRVADGIDPFELGSLLTDPAVYAIVVCGVGGFYLFTVALQSGSVNGAAAALVVGETVVPGVIGILALGDATRPGWGLIAACAFVAAVAGAVTVALSGAAPQG